MTETALVLPKRVRRSPGKYMSDTPIADPVRALCCAVLFQAVEDWRVYRRIDNVYLDTAFYCRHRRIPKRLDQAMAYARMAHCDSPSAELQAFFESDWFAELAELVDMNPGKMRKKLGIGDLNE